MFLLLQGAHYELAVARQSIVEKFSLTEEDKGYEAEKEEEPSKDNLKTMEEQLNGMEDKNTRLKESYTQSLEEFKCLKSKLANKNVVTKPNNPTNTDTDDTGAVVAK